MTQKIWEQGYTQNRELSWLQFNARVLAEAEDENVPLLERFKFLAIFTSNLDEFFMIRVGSLCDMAAVDKEHTDSKSGLTAKEQLHLIYKAVEPLYARRDAAFSDVDSKLSAIGLRRLTMDSLAPDEQKYIKRYFKDIIAPVLSPQIVDSHHPFPHLEGKVLHIAALLSHKKTERLGLLPVPASLPPLVFLPETPSRYILTEDILLAYADHVFEMYDVLEKTVLCVTRNADIQVDDETFGVEGGDFRKKMEKLLRQQFRPEFLNRLDEIVFYKPLTKENITAIVDLLIGGLNKRLADKQLKVVLTPAAKSYVIDNGYDPLYGARPLRRFLQHTVETLVGRKMIADEVAPGSTLTVDCVAGELVVH